MLRASKLKQRNASYTLVNLVQERDFTACELSVVFHGTGSPSGTVPLSVVRSNVETSKIPQGLDARRIFDLQNYLISDLPVS